MLASPHIATSAKAWESNRNAGLEEIRGFTEIL